MEPNSNLTKTNASQYNQVQQQGTTDLRTLLPRFSNITTWETADMIGTAPTNALEAIRSNKNQISGLVKESGTGSVDVVLVLLLNQIFSLTLSPVSNLQPFAVMIRRNFWDLRFEEIQYVLSKGISGGYGKIFGHLTYPIIAEWLQTYKETERAATVDLRAIERQTEKKVDLSDYEEGSPIDVLIKAFSVPVVQTTEEIKDSKPAPTKEFMDERQWGFFVANKANIKTEDLPKLLAMVKENEFTKTAESIEQEIERRANV